MHRTVFLIPIRSAITSSSPANCPRIPSLQIWGRLVVTYDSEQRKQCCTLTYRDSVRYKGNIIDMQLYQKRQDFMLENFFGSGSHAKLTITRDEDESNQKVALIYYANPKEDPLPDKTCICLLLSDVLL